MSDGFGQLKDVTFQMHLNKTTAGNFVDVSKNRGTPKWKVYFMENRIKMDDLGIQLFLETPLWETT